MTWYLATDRGASPLRVAWFTHSWTVDGMIRASGMCPKNGTKWLRR